MISGARQQMVQTQYAFIDAAKAAGVPHIVKFSGAESGVGFDARVARIYRSAATRMRSDLRSRSCISNS